MSEPNRTPETVTYLGGCDCIRTGSFNWADFGKDGEELMIGKKYDVITSCCMQWVYVKKDGKVERDDSGERYLYHKIKNEQGNEIYVWEGFFEENSNL